jgi:hypothetical protein
VGRFGNEGTGAHCFLDYNWKVGQTCRFYLTAEPAADKTTFTAYFYLPESSQWKRLASFRTATKGDGLKGYYSFIEDFRRDYKSAQERRVALFKNGWVRTRAGDWVALTRATFTADSNPIMTINAGVKDNQFFLATGGDTRNVTPLHSVIQRPPYGVSDLPK